MDTTQTDPTPQFIDVREAAEFETEKIPGSQLVPLSRLEQLSDALDRERPVLLVCRTGRRADQAATVLAKKGFSDVRVLEGGLEAWKAKGHPIERGSRRVWALERQVRFAAGTLVLIGVVLGHFVNAGWYALSAFVGAGLVFAAVTDTCGMALLLARMPWNQK